MRNRSFWSISVLAIAATVLFASCGGETLAIVAFIGSAGGDWRADTVNSAAGLQPRVTCGPASDEACFVNIAPVTPSFYATAFDVTFSANLPGCPGGNTNPGRIDGKRISLPGCFTGRYVTVNEALSDDGANRMFFNFIPTLSEGVWVEIQDGRRKFQFTNNAQGCEFTAAGPPAVTVALELTNFDSDPAVNVALPSESTITSLTIGGGAPYTGRFIGVSGIELRRGSEVIELERRNETASPACPP